MSTQREFTVLCEYPTSVPSGRAGLLFECAPDSPFRQNRGDLLPLAEMVGRFDVIKEHAFRVARSLLQAEPAFRGVRHLGICIELVIRELQFILHAKTLHDRLAAERVSICVFNGPSRIAEVLQWMSRQLGSDITVRATTSQVPADVVSMIRSWRRLRLAGFSRATLRSEWTQLLERVDRFHRRAVFWRCRSFPRNAIWFYSTAYTFTRAGLMYERYFPGPFEYLVENPETGGVPLTQAGRAFASPYEFAGRNTAPTKREISEAQAAIVEHLKSIDLPSEDAVLRDAYLRSPGLATFLYRLLPLGLFHATLFERYVEIVRPAAVVVGNPGFEGYALHAARKAGVPTLLLQHGILGDFCQFVDPPADTYIVRGEFWREFLAPGARARSLVLNPGENASVRANIQEQKRSVLFLTASYGQQEFWDESDIDDILRTLLAACWQGGADLAIRVHPMEQIGAYEAVIRRLAGEVGARVRVTYSQGPGLDDLLARSAVAVTYSSTVFLDCLRYRVPIVSFGWHDFSYKRQIEKYGIFHFCNSLAELMHLVRLALQGSLPAFSSAAMPFLADTSEAELTGQFHRLLDARMPAA